MRHLLRNLLRGEVRSFMSSCHRNLWLATIYERLLAPQTVQVAAVPEAPVLKSSRATRRHVSALLGNGDPVEVAGQLVQGFPHLSAM